MSKKDPITETLRETRIKRGLSVQELADVLDIPAERIYKWDQGKSAPKFEDRQRVEAWLSGKIFHPKEAKRETDGKQSVEKTQALGHIPVEEYIQVLREHNEFLRRNFEASLTGILVQGASILAHVATSLEKDDERDSEGDVKKLQQLKSETGRRIGEKLTVHGQKDMKIADK